MYDNFKSVNFGLIRYQYQWRHCIKVWKQKAIFFWKTIFLPSDWMSPASTSSHSKLAWGFVSKQRHSAGLGAVAKWLPDRWPQKALQMLFRLIPADRGRYRLEEGTKSDCSHLLYGISFMSCGSPLVHIFPNAQVASNKNLHKFWHLSLANYFNPFHMVWSTLL